MYMSIIFIFFKKWSGKKHQSLKFYRGQHSLTSLRGFQASRGSWALLITQQQKHSSFCCLHQSMQMSSVTHSKDPPLLQQPPGSSDCNKASGLHAVFPTSTAFFCLAVFIFALLNPSFLSVLFSSLPPFSSTQ